jgi:hypothetical protein
MSAAREALRVRRAQLVQRAEAERTAFAREFARWERPLRITDKSVAIVRTLKRMPVLGAVVGAGMAALAFVRPGRIVDWVPGGRVIWQVLASVLDKSAPRSR